MIAGQDNFGFREDFFELFNYSPMLFDDWGFGFYENEVRFEFGDLIEPLVVGKFLGYGVQPEDLVAILSE